MNFGDRDEPRLFRGMIAAEPGEGKTGSIVSLAEAGYSVRILDFDGNLDPIDVYASDEAKRHIDVLTFQDKLSDVNERYIASDTPTAFTRGYKALTKGWKDETSDLGKASEWGPDVVVVLDTLSSMGEAAKRRAMFAHSKNPFNMTSQVWGHAAEDQTNFLKMLAYKRNRFHVVVLAHKKTISAADILTQNDDAKGNEKIKEIKIEMMEGMPVAKDFPLAVTKNLSKVIAKELPILLGIERRSKGGKEQRMLVTQNRAEWDLGIKIPGKSIKSAYPIETGLADLFSDLGIKAPGK